MALATGYCSHPSCPSSSHCILSQITATHRLDPVRPRGFTGGGDLWSSCILTPLHSNTAAQPHNCTVSLVQWVNCLRPAYGGSSSCPKATPALLELGSPVSDVSQHYAENVSHFSPVHILDAWHFLVFFLPVSLLPEVGVPLISSANR